MKTELEQKFYDRWPEWFRGRTEGMQSNLMCFGFDHADGWFDLEWRLCEDLEKILGPWSSNYKLMQIKEKYGTLRWYDDGTQGAPEGVWDKVQQRIEQAEKESGRTCEICGQPGTIGGRGWISTLCPEHRNGTL